MEQTTEVYNHIIIIDNSRNYLKHLKQALISINYASQVSCFQNLNIAYQRLKNYKKFPEVIFLNMTETRSFKLFGSFIKEFNHLARFIITSPFNKIIDLEKSTVNKIY